jgi:hypothetical protein
MACILEEVANAEQDILEQLRTDEIGTQNTSALIESVSTLLTAIENSVGLTAAPLATVCKAASVEVSARCYYELMMWVERQNVNGLQRALRATLDEALASCRECGALAAMNQAIWEEKTTNEGEVKQRSH